MPADLASSELLRAIVRRPAHAPRIARLAENVRDWDSLLHLAREHRVSPMLFSRLPDMGPVVPSTVQEQLRAEYHRNVFHNLANAKEWIGLLHVLDRQGIPAVPFKCVVLGASIYGGLTTRPAGEVDVLIHYRHLAPATAVLLEMGCELPTPVRANGEPADPHLYEYHLERPADGMDIELRCRLELTYSRSRRDLGMDWV